MKYFLIFTLSFLSARSLFAVGDGAVAAAATHAQTIMQKAEYQLMRLQAVQQAKILYDNYMESKNYYDMMVQKSRHRGGLMGYYSDLFTERVKSDALNEWERIQQLKNKSEDTQLKRWVEGGEQAVIDSINKGADRVITDGETRLASLVDVANDFYNRSKKREEQLVILNKEASTGKLDDKKVDSLILQIGLMQLEYLAAQDQATRIKIENDIQEIRKTLLQEKKNLAYSRSLEFETHLKNQHQGSSRSKGITEEAIFKALKEAP